MNTSTYIFVIMRVKSETNLVGCLMYVIFLMGSIGKYTHDAYYANSVSWDFVEIILILPLSLVSIFFLSWVLFDSSWLNFDDDEKEKDWKKSRWLKFSFLFLFPLCKIFTKNTWDTSDFSSSWGENIAQQIQYFLLIFFAYLSLCSQHGSGLGRLFQPHTIPRSKIYTDSKGQKFELNFVGTTLSIVLIVLPFWVMIMKPLGRLLVFVLGKAKISELAGAEDTGRFLSSSPEARAIADSVVLIMIVYSFTVIFVSCVRVNFFLNRSYNFLKFSPIPLTPIAMIFSDNLCGYMHTSMRVKEWITMLCFFMVCFVAYASLASPPDSLSAILFQPHIPMIEIVKDLPDMSIDSKSERPRSTVVFPEDEKIEN